MPHTRNQKHSRTIGVIIPAYQPSPDHLKELIRRLKAVCPPQTNLLIVDDGSPEPVQIAEVGLPLTIIRHPQNRGKGAALKSGFHFFLRQKPVDLIFTIDADLQHPPEKIPEFLQAYHAGKFRVIVGYRRRNPKIMPFHRILSNSLTSLIISLLIGQNIRDSQCGFRLIDARLLEHLRLNENRFHLESELLVRAGWMGARIGFVSIPTIYTNQKSSIKNVADTLNFISLITKLIKERTVG